MGGPGSGNFGRKNRPPWRRNCVDFCKRIPISLLVRNRVFQPDRVRGKTIRFGDGSEIVLRFSPGSERFMPSLRFLCVRGESTVDEEVKLTTTKPRFGGVRWWFICPGPSCGRRVSLLCLPANEMHFRCRACHLLTYRCQQAAYSCRVTTPLLPFISLFTLRNISLLGPKPRSRK